MNHRGNTETGHHDSIEMNCRGSTETGHRDSTEMNRCGSTEIGHRDSTEKSSCKNINQRKAAQHNAADNQKKMLSPNNRLQKSLPSVQRSPLAELLVYPTPAQKISKAKSCARVLTSADSIALLEEKVHKKERSKRRKIEGKRRELKKAAREAEKKRKAEEKQAKQTKKQKKAEKKGTTGQKRSVSSVRSRSKRQRLDRKEN